MDVYYEFDDDQYRWNKDRDLKEREHFFASGYHVFDKYEGDGENIMDFIRKGLREMDYVLRNTSFGKWPLLIVGSTILFP